MVSKKEESELQLLKARLLALEEENQKIREENKGASGFNELNSIRNKGKSTSGHIQYKDTKDYVPVTMYQVNGYDVGRSRGPFHPTNAEDAFMRFSKIGIILSVKKPTEKEIEKYKETKEYKDLEAQENRRRKLKDKSKKDSEVEKLTRAIASMANIPLDQVNQIKQQNEVGIR